MIIIKTFCVYCHTTPSGRKYVGISCEPKKRWNDGKGYSKNYIFYRAIEKYGWENIKHEILYDGLDVETAKDIEAKLISDWQLTDKKYGYNLVDQRGGISKETHLRMSKAQMGNKNGIGRKLSPETRQKISKSLKSYFSDPEHRERLYKPHSEETKEKLRNRKTSPETRAKISNNHYDCSGTNNPSAKRIVQLSLSGEIIKEFPYATLAAKEYGLDLSSIIKCCRGKTATCGGYRWAYK